MVKGTLFENQGLLGKDELHLTKGDKSIFASQLANLMRRTENDRGGKG